MNELQGDIYQRSDGGYDVTHNGALYGPIYPNSEGLRYTWSQVAAYAATYPDRVKQESGPTLGAIKAALRDAVDGSIPAKRKAGFTFNGTSYQADPGVSEAVNGVLTAMGAGVPVGFPLPWRSGDNQRPSWPDPVTFTEFAGTLLAFVNGLYQAAWNTKDAIAAATTEAEARAAFDAWSAL
jgi:hypothetical protein